MVKKYKNRAEYFRMYNKKPKRIAYNKEYSKNYVLHRNLQQSKAKAEYNKQLYKRQRAKRREYYTSDECKLRKRINIQLRRLKKEGLI